VAELSDIESLLRQALAPVEPPADLEERLENRFSEALELAAEELEGWELGAMRDPRNWHRPVVAGAVGGAAAVGLVLVRTQRKRHQRREKADNLAELAESTLRDLFHEAGRLIDDAQKRR
jgi:hypothetical protein